MYRILGVDRKEYGPVTDGQIRQWIAEGRADARTLAIREGMADWKPLSEFPEFDADLGIRPAAPPVPPTLGGPAEAEALAAGIITRGYELNIGCCFNRGWELVKANFWLTVGVSALMMLLSSVAGAVPHAGAVALLLLNYVFYGGLDWMFLKLVRGQPVQVEDAFAGFKHAFLPLMLFSLAAQLLVSLGLVCCILPGIYLGIAWLFFSPLLILDRKLEFWPAMECSRKVVTFRFMQLFLFALLSLVVMLCGALACGIGIFIALPIVTAAKVYAYEDIFGTPAALVPPPSAAPLAPAPLA